MKKNIRLNKQIIKALSIGISASMLLQPVTAYAGELDTTTPEPQASGSEDPVDPKQDFDGVEADAVVADQAVDTAIEASHEAIDAVTGSTAYDETKAVAVSFNDVLNDNEEELADDVVDTTDEKTSAEEYVEKAEQDNMLAIAADVSAGNAADDQNADVSAGNKAQADAETLATATLDSVSGNAAIVAEERYNIEHAGTIDQAKDAYKKATNAIKAADDTVKQAETDYKEIEKRYNAAKNDYELKDQAYRAAMTALEAARADFALDVSAGVAETTDAKARLEALETEAHALKVAADEALEKYKAEAGGYYDIQEYEAKAAALPKGAGGENYKNILDPLFEAIMKAYYGPEVVKSDVLSVVWTKFDDNDKLNYATVTFANGDVQILNYRRADKNQAGGLIIFEKVEHVVYGKTFDVFSETELAALDNGEVIEKDGKLLAKNPAGEYVVYDEKQATETKNYEESETVSISDEQVESYSFDEEGHLVKTVKADVTTTTMRQSVSLSAEPTYGTAEAAKAAYIEALQEQVDALGEGETLVVDGTEIQAGTVVADLDVIPGYVSKVGGSSDVVGYNISATYNDKFTKTVELKGTFTKEDNGGHSVNKDKAKQLYEKLAKDTIAAYDFPTTHSTTVTSSHIHGADIGGNSNRRTYDGGVTVTYTSVDSIPMEGDRFMQTGTFDEEMLKKAVADRGLDFVGYVDEGCDVIRVFYVKTYTAEDVYVDATGEEDAISAFLEKLGDNVANVNITSKEAKTGEKFGYEEIACFIKKVATSNETITTYQWAEIFANADVQWRNDNFNAGKILLAEYDNNKGDEMPYDYRDDNNVKRYLTNDQAKLTKDFRQKVDGVKKLADMYKSLQEKAGNAEAAVKAAWEKVDDLEKAIKTLETVGARADEIEEFKAELDKARADLDKAVKMRDDLLDEIEEIADELDDKIDDLTPDVTPSEPTGGDEDVTPPAEPEEPAPAAPVVFAAAPAAPVVVVDEPTPQAATPEVEEPDDVVVEDDPTALAAAPITVGDDTTPLASMPNQSEMSWWWLLIVLILGATGAEMYRRHMGKKKAAEANTTEIK